MQGNQLSFSDLGSGHNAPQQQAEFEKPNPPPSLYTYGDSDESLETQQSESLAYSHPNSHSLNLVA